jgi:4-hydroxythreonine-4-phosphate dehydrogenase
MGDPAGIGPEITLKAWHALKESHELQFAVIGPLSIYEDAAKSLGMGGPIAITDASQAAKVFSIALPVIDQGRTGSVTPGAPSTAQAEHITRSIAQGTQMCLAGEAAALVTCPIAKDVLYRAGFPHPGHTEYLGDLTKDIDMGSTVNGAAKIRGPVMMLSGGGLRVALATVHVPLKDAAIQLSADSIIHTAKVMHEALMIDFGIAAPRIALAGLNPHAGEGGALGREEIEIINPAAASLRAMGIDASDAQPADTLFHEEARRGYDAVLAMYHDQGLIPVKTLDFHGGVNITLGLPIVRSSPDHGTAFSIAGKGLARPDSLIAALKSAREIADRRYAR